MNIAVWPEFVGNRISMFACVHVDVCVLVLVHIPVNMCRYV